MRINLNHFMDSASGRRVRQFITKERMKPAELIQMVLEEVQSILPGLVANATYSTEALCGPDLWNSWLTGERRSAGMCIRYLIENDHLPLELASLKGDYPLRFRVKAPL